MHFSRRAFLKTAGLGAAAVGLGTVPLLSGCVRKADQALAGLDSLPVGDAMPTLFIGHGSPMNALADNDFTRALRALGESVPRPRAVMVVSAHWLTPGSWVNTFEKPGLICDFSGFPKELYDCRYPCPGAPDVARAVAASDPKKEIQLDEHDWRDGLDHGAWTILMHLFPKADVPVFQLSIDENCETKTYYELGGRLASLRQKGVLVVGSGNIVHNLYQNRRGQPFDWAVEFDAKVKTYLQNGDHGALIDYQKMGKIADLAHPSNEHYLPLLYVIGMQTAKDAVTFPHEGFQGSGCSMRAVRIG